MDMENDEPLDLPQNTELSVSQLEDLCRSFFDQRVCVDSKKEDLRIEQTKLDLLERKILSHFEHYEIAKRHIKGVGTLSIRTRSSVRVPKDPESRAAFFQYLKERGIFDHLITVNSQTLNAWYNEQFEHAQAEGELSFSVPGLDEPSLFQSLVVRKDF